MGDPDNEEVGDRPMHVVPCNDLHEHDTSGGSLCPCMPLLSPNGNVVHNAYDRREIGEVGRLALYALGVALADHGHVWTEKERWAFEHLDHLLALHWPAKPAEQRRQRPF